MMMTSSDAVYLTCHRSPCTNGNAVRIKKGTTATLYCNALLSEAYEGAFFSQLSQPTKVPIPPLCVSLVCSQQEEEVVSNLPLTKLRPISLAAAQHHPLAFFY